MDESTEVSLVGGDLFTALAIQGSAQKEENECRDKGSFRVKPGLSLVPTIPECG
jgi:hypothetical protein